MFSENIRRNSFIFFFLLPSLLLYFVFVLYPNVLSLYYSFFNWDGLSYSKQFVGLQNFVRIVTDDPFFYPALVHNLFFLVTVPVFTLILSIFFAVVLTQQKFKESEFYKIVFYFPNVLSIVLIGLITVFAYHPRNGLLNNVLVWLGFESFEGFAWLGRSSTALASLVFPQVWAGVGFYMVLMIAAVNGIPKSIYEAAEIDGAGKFLQSIYITLPLIWDVLKISIAFFIINAFGAYQLILVTTNGGPLGSTEVLGSYMLGHMTSRGLGTGFVSNFGYASAIGTIIFIIIMAFTLIQYKLMKKESNQY